MIVGGYNYAYIPALPGYFVINFEGDSPHGDLIREDIIAWEIRTELNGESEAQVTPVTIRGVGYCSNIEDPYGTITTELGPRYSSVDLWRQGEIERLKKKGQYVGTQEDIDARRKELHEKVWGKKEKE